MFSEHPDLTGLVVTGQNWKRLDERDGLTIMQVEETVLERAGPLSQPFQDPPLQRKVYLDGCGMMPKGQEEFAALSPFPMLSEDSLEENDEWVCSELVPNHPEPLDISYRLSQFLERDDELVARLHSQASSEHLEVQGRYEFSVSRGLLLRGQLQVKNRLPEGQTVSLRVDLKLQA
jgi:hypothetical protein